jgi:hypothetical protein
MVKIGTYAYIGIVLASGDQKEKCKKDRYENRKNNSYYFF